MSNPNPTPPQPPKTSTDTDPRETSSVAGPPSLAPDRVSGPPASAALDARSKCDGNGECDWLETASKCFPDAHSSRIVQNARLPGTLGTLRLDGTLASDSPSSSAIDNDSKSHSASDNESKPQLVDGQLHIDNETSSQPGGEGATVGGGGLVGIHSPNQPKILPKEISESKLSKKRVSRLDKKNNVLYIARKKREYWAKLAKEDAVGAEEYKVANGWAWAVRDGSKDRRVAEPVGEVGVGKVTYVSGDGETGSLSTYEEGNVGSYVSGGKLAQIVANAVAKAVGEALAKAGVSEEPKLVEEKIIRWTERKESVVWNEGEEEVVVVGAPRNQFIRMVKKGDGSIWEMGCRGKMEKMVGWRVGVTVIDGKMTLAGKYGRNGGRVG